MLEEDLLYTLALQRAKGVGDINAKKLIAHYGSAKEVLLEKRSTLEKINGVGNFISNQLLNPLNLKAAEKELGYIQKNKMACHYFLDNDYPEKLKHCVDGPILLFSKGTIALNKQRIISIVGTRQMTSYGRLFCSQFIEELASYNPIILSGFAYGIDICAHKAALKNKLQTVGVLAHGFEEIYPKSHAKYVNGIEENGGFLTDFWHNDPLLKENFIKRNRIVAGISEATIVIESAEKGGALITADIANSYNRDVFAVPGRVTDTYSKGCNQLIEKNKAALLNSASDLATYLNWMDNDGAPKTIQKQLFVELFGNEQKVYQFLEKNGKALLDSIALKCQLSIQETTTLLFALEMKGMLKPLPGKLYEAI